VKKKSLAFLLFNFIGLFLYSQNNITFYGKTMSTNGFVYNVNIINNNTNTGSVSNTDGDFSIKASLKDTITFSCIGFKSFDYIIPDTIKNNEFRVLIFMIEDTVFLKEAIVRPWPVNTTVLKEAFLNEKNTEKEIVASYAGFREIEGPQREPAPTVMNPISFIANIFSKKRIQQKKMNRIRKKLQEN